MKVLKSFMTVLEVKMLLSGFFAVHPPVCTVQTNRMLASRYAE